MALIRKYKQEIGFLLEKDLKYCSVPVPPINDHKGGVFDFTTAQIAGYGQSQTHPSIVYIPGGFGGHEYWMATTPYPKAIGVFENPCIYYGDADVNGNPPLVWTPINGVANGIYNVTNNPIVKVQNNTEVNSDPDLFYDSVNNKLCMISRENNNGFATYYQESLNGQAWTPKPDRATKFLYKTGIGELVNFPELLSPAVLKIGGKWRIYTLTGNAGYLGTDTYLRYQNSICKGVVMLEGTTFADGGDFKVIGKAAFLGKSGINPWHFDVSFNPADNKYYAIICGVDYDTLKAGAMYLLESTDGLNFKIYSKPISNAKSFYRPSFVIKNDGTLVLYWCTEVGASTLAADYPNGASDIPIDGRAVGLNTMKVADLVRALGERSLKGWV